MVQLRFENFVAPSKGEQQKPWIELTNQAGLSPAEQWFYRWVHNTGLAAPYPDADGAIAALLIHLPERTKRYSRNIPDPASGESWLRLVLVAGELIRLQADPNHPPITVAVHPSTSEWTEGFEEISSHKFSAARHALGIDKHWRLVFESIAEVAPSSQQLIDALHKQALDPAECAIIHI